MSFSRFSMALVAAASLVSTAALADTITVTDKVASGVVASGCNTTAPSASCAPYNWTPVNGYDQTITTGPSWAVGKTYHFGDVVGGSEYNINSLTITRNASNVVFTINTNFDGSNSHGTKYADIFIDTNSPSSPNTWNYGIALGNDQFGNALTRDGVAGGLYAVTPSNYLTSNQVWQNTPGFGIGGLASICSPGNNLCTGPAPGYAGTAIAPATLLASSGLGASIGSVVTTKVFNGTNYILTVTVTPANMSIFNNFDVLIGSADCFNDGLWGEVPSASVPAPGALALLGLGMLGFAGLRRRRAA